MATGMSSHSAGILSADRSDAGAGEFSRMFTIPNSDWLYIVGRVKPGVAIAPLQEKVKALLRQALATNRSFSSEQGKTLLAKVHVVLTPGGAGIQDDAGAVWVATAFVDVDCRPCAVDCLREYCESAAGAWDGTARGNVHARCAGSNARKNCPPIADGERRVGRDGRYRRAGGRLCGNANAADAGVSRGRRTYPSMRARPVGNGVCMWACRC